jgi:hypothetical protein
MTPCRGTWVWLFISLGLACGDDSSPTPSGMGGSGQGGDGGDSGQGGGGAAGAANACGSAVPVLNAATGLERCAAGFVRRVRAGVCPSAVPRAAAVAGYDPSIDECQLDSECSALPHGHCAPREGGSARTCVAGCLTDDDCEAGRLCACDEPVGRCVPASCKSGADCAPGFECASYTTKPNCFSTGFACQTPADTCAGDADPACDGFSVNATFCVYGAAGRQCSQDQCTVP